MRVYTCIVCIRANVYSMYVYVSMHISMYPFAPVDVVGGGWGVMGWGGWGVRRVGEVTPHTIGGRGEGAVNTEHGTIHLHKG